MKQAHSQTTTSIRTCTRNFAAMQIPRRVADASPTCRRRVDSSPAPRRLPAFHLRRVGDASPPTLCPPPVRPPRRCFSAPRAERGRRRGPSTLHTRTRTLARLAGPCRTRGGDTGCAAASGARRGGCAAGGEGGEVLGVLPRGGAGR